MKGRISRSIVALVVALGAAVGLVGVKTVQAEGEENSGSTSQMTVSPMNQKIILTPGESYTGAVKISNPAGAEGALKYLVKVGSFNVVQKQDPTEEDDGTVDTGAVTEYNQMMEWITVDREGGEVQPNETQVVTYTINVPEDAPGGGQYASLLFQNDSMKEGEKSGTINIENQVQIASLIYAEVEGDSRQTGQILDNEVPGFITTSHLKAASMVENTGNVHTDAKYTLQVWPLFSDEEICTNEEKPGMAVVMPETKQYHVESCEVKPVGVYKVRHAVKIFGEESIVEKTLFVCPVWLMIVIGVLILCVVVMIVRAVRKHKKAQGPRE